MNIVQALDDPHVFGPVIKDHNTWCAWRGFLKALFGLPMDEAEAALFRDCTGRTTLPTAVFGAAWLVCGRRGGKSFALALIAVFLACFRDYRPHLAMGERATVVIVAADRRQARVIFRYIRGIMDAVPALRALVEGETAEELRLKTPVSIAELDNHLVDGTTPTAMDRRLPEGDLKRELLKYTPKNRQAAISAVTGARSKALGMDEGQRTPFDEMFPNAKRLKGGF